MPNIQYRELANRSGCNIEKERTVLPTKLETILSFVAQP